LTVPVDPLTGVIVTVVLIDPPGEEMLSALAPNVTVKGNTVVRVRLAFAVCGGELESVTLNVSTALLTAAVGMPLISPVDEFSVKPPGNVPEVSVHV
jgi:hypothetical protein